MSEHQSEYSREFAVVGKLVLTFNALDWQTNHVVIQVFNLGEATLLEPVVATLDISRKIHMLKEMASVINENEWKKNLLSYCKKSELVTKQRNISCHSVPVLLNGVWVFKSIQATKIFKSLDLKEKELSGADIEQFQKAILQAEEALAQGVDLVENFKRLNMARRCP